MTWIITTVSLIGNYFNCKKLRVGFLIWIVANTCWLAIDITNGTYSRAVLDVVQTAFCIFGFVNWGGTDGKEKT